MANLHSLTPNAKRRMARYLCQEGFLQGRDVCRCRAAHAQEEARQQLAVILLNQVPARMFPLAVRRFRGEVARSANLRRWALRLP